MANQAFQTLCQQTPAELAASLVSIERELQQLRFKLAMRDLDDTSQFKKLRHRRSQVLTLIKNPGRQVAMTKVAVSPTLSALKMAPSAQVLEPVTAQQPSVETSSDFTGTKPAAKRASKKETSKPSESDQQ